MKLSTTSADLIHETHSTQATIRAIATTGFKHFNLCFTGEERLDKPDWMDTVAQIQTALEETETDAVLAHAVSTPYNGQNREELIQETLRTIKACEVLNVPDLVVHPLYYASFGMRDMYVFNKAFYREIIDRSAGSNVNILIENAGDSETHTCMFISGRDLREFIEYADHPRMGACWDTAHCNLNASPRDNQYDNIIAIGDKLRALHVSDNYGIGMHLHTFPLAGNIDFDSIMYGLKDINYKGAFNFEAGYTVRYHATCPMFRKTRDDYNGRPALLLDPSKDLRLKAESLLYECGKFVLTQHGVFED